MTIFEEWPSQPDPPSIGDERERAYLDVIQYERMVDVAKQLGLQRSGEIEEALGSANEALLKSNPLTDDEVQRFDAHHEQRAESLKIERQQFAAAFDELTEMLWFRACVLAHEPYALGALDVDPKHIERFPLGRRDIERGSLESKYVGMPIEDHRTSTSSGVTRPTWIRLSAISLTDKEAPERILIRQPGNGLRRHTWTLRRAHERWFAVRGDQTRPRRS